MSVVNTKLDRERLQNRLGYHFQDESLLDLALTHRSCGGNNNERLEFLGDAVLDLVVGELLFGRFPEAREGELSRMRSNLVKGTSLARVARQLNIGNQLNLGGGERKSGGQRRDSILADALEALIGAIYLDAGLVIARQRTEEWLVDSIAGLSKQGEDKDAKTRLQEYLQGQGKSLPEYQVEHVKGDPHDQTFVVSCNIELLEKPVMAEGSSRRGAEQAAADKILQQLRNTGKQVPGKQVPGK